MYLSFPASTGDSKPRKEEFTDALKKVSFTFNFRLSLDTFGDEFIERFVSFFYA